MSSNGTIVFRNGKLNDLDELQTLFIETISEVCKNDYNEKQIAAWINSAISKSNMQRWVKMIKEQFVLIAQIDSNIVGFATLDKGSYIDMFYIHKEYQRQGIAGKLFFEIEKEAKRHKKMTLSADVSKTALLFFERKSFKIIKEKVVFRDGVELKNYKMEKIIEY